MLGPLFESHLEPNGDTDELIWNIIAAALIIAPTALYINTPRTHTPTSSPAVATTPALSPAQIQEIITQTPAFGVGNKKAAEDCTARSIEARSTAQHLPAKSLTFDRATNIQMGCAKLANIFAQLPKAHTAQAFIQHCVVSKYSTEFTTFRDPEGKALSHIRACENRAQQLGLT